MRSTAGERAEAVVLQFKEPAVPRERDAMRYAMAEVRGPYGSGAMRTDQVHKGEVASRHASRRGP